VADKEISSRSAPSTGDTATGGVDWISICKGARSGARWETAIAIEEEKFMKTTVSLWIDHGKAVIVFVTGRDEEIKLINSNVEKQHRQSGVSVPADNIQQRRRRRTGDL
jgi:hypothetical protein